MNKIKTLFVRFLVILLAFQGAVAASLLTLQPAHADTGPEVVINEVMWMGSYEGVTSHASDEWIELLNTTSSPIDLTGWVLTHTATGGTDLTIGTGGTMNNSVIPANGYYLISHFDKTSTSSVLNVTPDWIIGSITLANPPSCSPITLENSSLATVDSMGCDSGSYFAGLNDTVNHIRKSMERNFVIADGTVATSWQTSVGFANLDSNAVGYDFATPKVVNDSTAPSDGTATAIPANFFDHATGLIANWQGFADAQSGIAKYDVGLGDNTTTANIIPLASVDGSFSTLTFNLGSATLIENTNYYILVQAQNGVSLTSNIIASSPVKFRETTAPDAFALIAASDVLSDNGGSVQLSWGASSLDVTDYSVEYQISGGSWSSYKVYDALQSTNAIISGLDNVPASYDFRVRALSFNGTNTLSTNVLTAQAIDNLVPIIDASKVVLDQNRPGNQDVVRGLAGASNESGQYMLFDKNNVLLGSGLLAADRSFAGLGIGDNKYDEVRLVVEDNAGNKSLPLNLFNDIVGPSAPTLNRVVANCPTDTCRVELNWQANAADSKTFQVTYSADGVANKTLEVSTTTLLMDIPTGKTYTFSVTALDQFGNPSAASNVFTVAAVKGVITTAILENGSQVTKTEAISGSREVVHKKVASSGSLIAPRAYAAETPPATETPPAQEPLVNAAKNQDWVRIFVVVVLLLIIAGSFYALSRSVQNVPEEIAPVVAKKAPTRKRITKKKPSKRTRR